MRGGAAGLGRAACARDHAEVLSRPRGTFDGLATATAHQRAKRPGSRSHPLLKRRSRRAAPGDPASHPMAPGATDRSWRPDDPLGTYAGRVAQQPPPMSELALRLVLLRQPVGGVMAVDGRVEASGADQRPPP